MKNIKQKIENLAIKILCGKEKLSEKEKKELYDPENILGSLSEDEAKELLKDWLAKISETKRKKIISKMN